MSKNKQNSGLKELARLNELAENSEFMVSTKTRVNLAESGDLVVVGLPTEDETNVPAYRFSRILTGATKEDDLNIEDAMNRLNYFNKVVNEDLEDGHLKDTVLVLIASLRKRLSKGKYAKYVTECGKMLSDIGQAVIESDDENVANVYKVCKEIGTAKYNTNLSDDEVSETAALEFLLVDALSKTDEFKTEQNKSRSIDDIRPMVIDVDVDSTPSITDSEFMLSTGKLETIVDTGMPDELIEIIDGLTVVFDDMFKELFSNGCPTKELLEHGVEAFSEEFVKRNHDLIDEIASQCTLSSVVVLQNVIDNTRNVMRSILTDAASNYEECGYVTMGSGKHAATKLMIEIVSGIVALESEYSGTELNASDLRLRAKPKTSIVGDLNLREMLIKPAEELVNRVTGTRTEPKKVKVIDLKLNDRQQELMDIMEKRAKESKGILPCINTDDLLFEMFSTITSDENYGNGIDFADINFHALRGNNLIELLKRMAGYYPMDENKSDFGLECLRKFRLAR